MIYLALHLLWTTYMLCMATGMRENAHAGSVYNLNISVNESEHLQTVAAVASEAVFNDFPSDPFKDDPWFKERNDPNYDPFKNDPWHNGNRNGFNNGGGNGFNNGNRGGNGRDNDFWKHRDADSSPAGTPHDYHRPAKAAAGAAAGLALIGFLIWMSFFCCIVGLPCFCLCRGHMKARALRSKLENLQLKHPPHEQRQPAAALSDGMMRLAQEDRVMIKEKVNVAQELSGHVLGYSIQTANSFDVVSVAGGGEHVLSCREAQDLKAMLGMNLAAGLQAMGVDGAGAWAGRDKAPFRMLVGLPQAPNPMESGKMEVVIPDGVVSGQQIQVTAPTGEQFVVAVPPGVAPGQKMEVQLPGKAQSGPGMQEIMTGLVPGCAPNTDQPFLYLDRPFAIDCCCINRPKVDVFDVRGSLTVKLGIISDPFAWMDMTFGIHIGPNATESDPPTLVARGAGCQPGAVCTLCGLCCGRTCQEVYLEVVDPNDGDRTVAFITKGWAGGMQELFTSANSYVDFGEVKDPACKALLLATALFLNYRFFEGRAGKRGGSD